MSICDVYYSNHDHSALVASYNKVERFNITFWKVVVGIN